MMCFLTNIKDCTSFDFDVTLVDLFKFQAFFIR